jgi:hypothetical protein
MPLHIDEDRLPPTPGTGLCVCGAAYFYVRAARVGGSGHFHCLRCGRRYRFAETWSPGSELTHGNRAACRGKPAG